MNLFINPEKNLLLITYVLIAIQHVLNVLAQKKTTVYNVILAKNSKLYFKINVSKIVQMVTMWTNKIVIQKLEDVLNLILEFTQNNSMILLSLKIFLEKKFYKIAKNVLHCVHNVQGQLITNVRCALQEILCMELPVFLMSVSKKL